jgi:hypothetical protein
MDCAVGEEKPTDADKHADGATRVKQTAQHEVQALSIKTPGSST